jgi:DNA-binding CsgD family transcriptional regulator
MDSQVKNPSSSDSQLFNLDGRTIVLYNVLSMKPWERLFALLHLPPRSKPGSYGLDTRLHTALAKRADRVHRPLKQVEAELLAAGLERLETCDGLKRRWERLSQREQEVTALTCRGYTNRQMAASLHLSPSTIKGYLRQALSKWQAHSKDELRLMLVQWDFSDWGPPAR